MCNKDHQIIFKTSMLISSLCDYRDACILVKETIAVPNTAAAAAANNINKKVIFRNCAPFTNFISRIKNMQVNDAHSIDVVMSIYNLIEYSDNYSNTFRILWQYCRDETTLANNGDITDLNEGNADTNSFKIKE